MKLGAYAEIREPSGPKLRVCTQKSFLISQP